MADDLTPEQIKAYRLADNKTAEFSEWDNELLAKELGDIFDIDMSDFGFLSDEVHEIESPEREEVNYQESVSVVIDCENNEEAEKIYNQLIGEGYNCRISTL